MSVIYKYALPQEDEIRLEVPGLFKPLHVAEQNGQLCLWALTDPSTASQSRRILIYGTGHRVEPSAEFNYIGTVIMPNGLVWHVVDGGRV